MAKMPLKSPKKRAVIMEPWVGGVLAWRPLQLPSAEHMNVEVGDGFAAIWAVVDNDAVAAFCDVLLRCRFPRDTEQMTEKSGVLVFRFGDSGDWFSGGDEEVDGCLG